MCEFYYEFCKKIKYYNYNKNSQILTSNIRIYILRGPTTSLWWRWECVKVGIIGDDFRVILGKC